MWDLPKEDSGIILALFLSYHYLPSHLKRCFAYCALFPKDYEFVKEDLILLWMAENFLQCPQQSRHPEEVGAQYFNDLLSRSFFQQLSTEGYGTSLTSPELSIERHFVMHDLLNDLAKYVCGDFCFRLKFDKSQCIPKANRHFLFAVNDVRCFDGLGSLTDARKLRSFFPITEIWRFYYDWEFKISIHDLFSKMKFLRVLSFCGCLDLREVPYSIGDLKHLTSLDLSNTKLQKLTDSICLLYNLLILKLNYCSRLEELPSNLYKLTKLRCLEFKNTKVTKMPMHFGELKNLQLLSTFFVDRDSELSTKRLGGLNLQGRLSINEVQNIVNPLEALEANLKNKHLAELELTWKWDHIPDDPRKEKKVLENLQPFEHLEHLTIGSYCGTEFTSWVFDNSLSNLVLLELVNCKYCLCLPSLGLLSSLKTLIIDGFDGIVSIGAEFCGIYSSSFVSLERLEFENMKEWEEWEYKTTSFPRLQSLYMNSCPKLKGLSEQLHLKDLCIGDCDKLIISGNSMDTLSLELLSIQSCPFVNIPITHYDFLEQMYIHSGCDSLTIFPLDFFPKLLSLVLTWCQNLKGISQEHAHNHLKELTIQCCYQFESFPSEGLSAPWLQRIVIEECENLKLLPKRMQILLPSLTELWITDCPDVEMFPDGGLPSNVRHMYLSSFKLIASLRETLDANTCLQSLSMENVDVESIPDEVLLPSSLTFLRIYDCQNLKKMEYKGLCQLSSLELIQCPNLQCLAEEGLPKSISSLEIVDCPLLKQRCQNPEGEDWAKIAHIQELDIQ